MEVYFKSKKLQQVFEAKELQRLHGNRARDIQKRLLVLRAADSLKEFWPPTKLPERCHELKGKRKGEFAMDVKHPHRLIFKPENMEDCLKDDGGFDWAKIKSIIILGVENYHG